MNEAWFLSVNIGGIHAHPDGSTTICGMMQVKWRASWEGKRSPWRMASQCGENRCVPFVSLCSSFGFLCVPLGSARCKQPKGFSR